MSIRVISFDPHIKTTADEADKHYRQILEEMNEKRQRMLELLAVATSHSLGCGLEHLRLYHMNCRLARGSVYWFVADPGHPAISLDENQKKTVDGFVEKFGFLPHEAALKVQIGTDSILLGIVRAPGVSVEDAVEELGKLPEEENDE